VSTGKKRPIQVVLAQPRGFCAGVVRAIEIVELALRKYGPPVYVRHEIVHNKRVVEELRQKGAIFVEELTEIPDDAITVFSAHGVSQQVADDAEYRNLPVIDATCPLVAKVHKEGQRYAARDYDVVLIGHEGHPEVEGTKGRISGIVHLVSSAKDVAKLNVRNPDAMAYITQTTLSVDDTRAVIEALQQRFPKIVGPDVRDICYATQNRQSAVRALAQQSDVIIVVGAQNSSNSNRLREIGEESGVPSYLIDDADALEPSWFDEAGCIGITAGASAPEALVQEIIMRLGDFGEVQVRALEGIRENVQFKLPDQLQELAS
jgi:4-hydroxy-3-methylbut-2-enyl diphosphate reductase